ncbi:MAG: hypothetical protein E7658_08365 [Ruminococcaceae bacterium]|nr:hypothetical protein [Oscillospiraceae bacterium]
MSKKKISVLVLGMMLLCVLTSCVPSYYDKEEIGDALAELIPASMELNVIYFGEGLPFAEDEEEVKRFFDTFDLGSEVSNYYPVSENAPYTNEQEIRDATALVFSPAYCEYLYTVGFSGISDIMNEGTDTEHRQTVAYARYIEHYSVLTMRKLEAEDILPLNRTYDTSDFTVLINREEFVTAEVQSYVDGVKDERIEVKLVYTENGWRLDSPTY